MTVAWPFWAWKPRLGRWPVRANCRPPSEGKKLLDVFSGAPFGWSQVKLKVSGREVTVTGQQAIDALKNNNSFALRKAEEMEDLTDADPFVMHSSGGFKDTVVTGLESIAPEDGSKK